MGLKPVPEVYGPCYCMRQDETGPVQCMWGVTVCSGSFINRKSLPSRARDEVLAGVLATFVHALGSSQARSPAHKAQRRCTEDKTKESTFETTRLALQARPCQCDAYTVDSGQRMGNVLIAISERKNRSSISFPGAKGGIQSSKTT